ncbi:DUF1223 domain-containing protein [Aquimarina hainanensis]|uniref:DUF1223 domain-containing protein n=1 Tax=Aquimarina hainanensis TaxID=1578017 RepID=A0ABW5NBP3_9FLAO
MYIKKLLICIGSIVLMSYQSVAQEEKPFVLLELFTSQGCSSCPPADDLLKQITKVYKNENVYALSYHVDYWNRLGWKDPFSKEVYTDYQREYAYEWNSRSVYTPQLVVNGTAHFVGSDSKKAEQSIAQFLSRKPDTGIDLKVTKLSDEEIKVTYSTVNTTDKDKIAIVLVVENRTTTVVRGENRNRTLENSNIVAYKKTTSELEGECIIVIPDWVTTKDKLAIVGFTQNPKLKITAAAREQLQ